jgi:cytochrome P450/NADPH-cytochrome P450 reductase
MRGCIGRPFAWQEALLATATLLQYFNFDFVKEYNLRIKQTLTIKPTADFKMHARLRPGVDSVTLEQSMFGGVVPQAQAITGVHPDAGAVKAKGRPMTILYGSNTGTCQALAQGLASDAASHGFNADILELDAAIERVPKDQPVVIITASFEGGMYPHFPSHPKP